MGFLSKLFGNDSTAEKAAKDLFGSILSGASQGAGSSSPASSSASSSSSSSSYSGYSEPVSKYDVIPEEENQYNFGGTYFEYFEKIFMQELPAFSFEKGEKNYFGNTSYTFYQAGRKVLVVELMTERSGSRRVRNACAAEGVRYLRFYYDHEGWWNTRSYVAERLHKAVG